MEKLPSQWFINIRKDVDNKLMKKFQDWISVKFKEDVGFEPEFNSFNYGFDGKVHICTNSGQELTLEEWNEMTFREQFEKGEEVLVRDHESEGWDKAILSQNLKENI